MPLEQEEASEHCPGHHGNLFAADLCVHEAIKRGPGDDVNTCKRNINIENLFSLERLPFLARHVLDLHRDGAERLNCADEENDWQHVTDLILRRRVESDRLVAD